MRRPAIVACAAVAALAAGTAQGLAAAPGTSPRTYSLPPGTLRLSDTRLQASAGEHVTFTVKLTRRAVGAGTLVITLPRQWTGRSGVSGLAYARAPTKGSSSSSRVTVRRVGRVVTFRFTAARTGDFGRFTITDRGLPARTYSLPYAWREGTLRRSATATVTVLVPQRPPP